MCGLSNIVLMCIFFLCTFAERLLVSSLSTQRYCWNSVDHVCSLTPVAWFSKYSCKNILNWLEISFYSLWKNNCDYQIHIFSNMPFSNLLCDFNTNYMFLIFTKIFVTFCFFVIWNTTLLGMVFHFYKEHPQSFLTGNAWWWTSLLRFYFSEKCLKRILEILLLNVEFQIKWWSFQCFCIFSFATAAVAMKHLSPIISNTA